LSNINKVSYKEASGELKVLYDDIILALNVKELPNWVSYLGGNIAILKGIWQLFSCTVIEGTLPTLLQELILFSVSRGYGSAYCTEFHASNILKLNTALDFEQLTEIADGVSRGVLPEKYYTAIKVITQHSKTHCPMLITDLNEIRRSGFDTGEVLELSGLCSLALALNALIMAVNIPIDETSKVNDFTMPLPATVY